MSTYVAIDVESFQDIFGVGTKDHQTGTTIFFTSSPDIVGGLPLLAFRPWLDAQTDTLFLSINGQSYDNIMLRAVYDGEYDPAVLKRLSDEVINDRQDWKRRQKSVGNELHCDLLAMWGGKEQVSGSKEMAIKGNLASVRETPVDFDAPTTTDDEKRAIFHVYNTMDLDTILWAFAASRREIDNRLALIEEFGVNVLSEADAGVADQIMRSILYPTGGLPYPNVTKWRLDFRKIADAVIYQHPALIELQDRIRQMVWDFELVEEIEKGLAKKKIKGPRLSEQVQLFGITYRIAKGGIHSDDSPGFFIADDRFVLWECDFKSYYPMTILHHGICPAQVPRIPFLSSLRKLVDKRLATNDKTLASGLKIAINSIFGKGGSPYSWLCDPCALITCTMLGQLQVLMLIDLATSFGEERLQIVSTNTDGVVMRIDRAIVEEVKQAANELATLIGQRLEWTPFSRVVRRDINNYVAFGLDGEIVKAKGAYQYEPDKIKGKATNRICIDAAQMFFLRDTPVADTVRACRDTTKFIDYRKTQRGFVLADDQGRQYGAVARWYVGTSGVHLDVLKLADGARTQVVERGAVLIPDLPTEMPDDVDYEHYIRLAEALVTDITDPPVVVNHTIPIAELNKAQRDRWLTNRDTMAADAATCQAVDLTAYRKAYAAVCRGNMRDSMKHVLLRLWWREEGALSQGDLLYLAKELDAGSGYFTGRMERNLEQMVEWIACDISPFHKPRSTLECAEQALGWAVDNVEPVKRRRKMRHTDAVIGSSYLNAESLAHFAKTGNEYRLACKIAAASFKHDAEPNPAFIAAIIADVIRYVADHPDLAKPQSAMQQLKAQQRWNYFSTSLLEI